MKLDPEHVEPGVARHTPSYNLAVQRFHSVVQSFRAEVNQRRSPEHPGNSAGLWAVRNRSVSAQARAVIVHTPLRDQDNARAVPAGCWLAENDGNSVWIVWGEEEPYRRSRFSGVDYDALKRTGQLCD